jgi:hypothetical protein
MAPDPQRTQEQSIKARKHQLFEADEPVRSETDGPRQSFQDCLKTTPAEPLSTPIKALLWVMGTVVILLLIIALATGGPRKPKPKPVSGFVPQQQSGFVLASHNGFVPQ